MYCGLIILLTRRVVVFELALFACTLAVINGARAGNVAEEFSVARGGDYIIVPILVETKRYQFLLDTGSTYSCFNRRHRATLGGPPSTVTIRVSGGDRRVERFIAPRMSLGGTSLQMAALVLCDDLSKFERHAGCAIDGILGMDALEHLVVNIDFDDGKVRILDSADGAPGTAVPILRNRPGYLRGGPFISVKVGAVRHEFLVDSGSIWQTIGTMDVEPFDAHVTQGSMEPLRKSEPTGGRDFASLARARSIKVASFTHENAIMGREAFWNALGVGFLARYIVTFDFPNNLVYLKPGKEFATPDRLDASGINMSREQNEVAVADVKPGSPGDKAGVRRGDLIVRIDGEAASGWSFYRVQRLFAKPGEHTLDVRREGGQRELRLIIPHDRAAAQSELKNERP